MAARARSDEGKVAADVRCLSGEMVYLRAISSWPHLTCGLRAEFRPGPPV